MAPSLRERRLPLWISLALVAAVAAVFGQVADHAYLPYDDDEVITGAAALRQGLSWEGIRWAFTAVHVANWLPLPHLSLLADQELHGLSPRFVLLENVALHGLASVLLFHAFRRMTGATWRSGAVAALFAIHPLHVESVAWASLRKDVLSGVFLSLTLLAYVRATERPTLARHALVALSFCAGLLSKSTLVTLPLVLLLLDLWPLGRLTDGSGALSGRRVGRAVAEKLPLLALAAASSVATLLAQRVGGTVVSVQHLPFPQRLGNAVVAYADYLRTALWPADLAAFYPAPVEGFPLPRVLASAAVVLGITLACFLARRRRPWLLVGWLWFVGMLVPTIGLVQVGSQARADRYTYLPMIGLSILPVWAAGELAERRSSWRRPVAVASMTAMAALGVAAHRQVATWRDGVTLLSRALAVTPENPLTHSYLAEALLQQGRPAEAALHMRAALRQKPDYVEMMNNLAWLLATNPNVAPADPGEPFRLAVGAVEATGGRNPQVLYTLATVFAREGRFPEAERTALRAAGVARALGAGEMAAALETKAAAFREGRMD